VYRRRRLVVLLVLLAIAAAVVLAIWQPWQGSPAVAPSASQTPRPTASTSSPAPSPAETETDAPASADPAPSPTATTAAACTTSDISVLAVTDKDSYGGGEQPQLSITLSNTSANPCLINVGTSKQSFVIMSGSDTWWRSTDCQSESSDQVVQLDPGQTVSSVTPLTWDRTRSSVDTCDSARPAALPGTYNLQVSVGGIEAADTKRFELR